MGKYGGKYGDRRDVYLVSQSISSCRIRMRISHLAQIKHLIVNHLTNIQFQVNLSPLSGAYADRARLQSVQSQNGTHLLASNFAIE